MGKQIKFDFAKGGSFIVDLYEDKAPETCKIIWDMLEEPWSEKFIHTGCCGWMVETPYFPVPEDYVLPNENLIFAPQEGEVAVVSPAEWRENSIKGYLPLFFSAWASRPIPTLELLAGKTIDVSHDTGESVQQQYKKNLMETCRANVFARLKESDLEEAAAVVRRIRTQGIESFTIARV